MSVDTISIFGLGYIGLPTAAMFASKRKKVIGVDVDQFIVSTINAGEIHIIEPELDRMVREVVKKGQLKATLSPEPADAFLIAVPTPFLTEDDSGGIREPDLSYIKKAAFSLSNVLKQGDLVVLESTSPVGTTERLARWLSEARPDLTFPQTHGDQSDIRIAYCPERVLPGNVVSELVSNDRVIGGMTTRCSEAATALYATFVKGECVTTNARTAEMSKLTENASRDVAIAFANELSIICDGLEIDTQELITLANRHPRVNILQPGCGVGGHCIAVDPWFIVSRNPEQAQLIQTARRVNDTKPAWVVKKVWQLMDDFLSRSDLKRQSDVVIACWGLAFKPDIDDLRESPALLIAKKLSNSHSGPVYSVEPNIDTYEGDDLELVNSEIAINEADLHVFLVKHSEFKGLSIGSKPYIDVCGIFEGAK